MEGAGVGSSDNDLVNDGLGDDNNQELTLLDASRAIMARRSEQHAFSSVSLGVMWPYKRFLGVPIDNMS